MNGNVPFGTGIFLYKCQELEGCFRNPWIMFENETPKSFSTSDSNFHLLVSMFLQNKKCDDTHKNMYILQMNTGNLNEKRKFHYQSVFSSKNIYYSNTNRSTTDSTLTGKFQLKLGKLGSLKNKKKLE